MDTPIKKSTLIRIIFWITIPLGILLPVILKMLVDIVVSHDDLMTAFSSGLTLLKDSFSLWLVHSIPFIFIALMMVILLYKNNNQEQYNLQRYGILGAWILTFVISIWLNLEVWISLALLLPGFSTGMLVYYGFSVFGFVIAIIGYMSGLIVGKKVLNV